MFGRLDAAGDRVLRREPDLGIDSADAFDHLTREGFERLLHLRPVTPTNTPTTADSALFSGTPGSLQLLAREGGPVRPVGGGAVYGDVDASNVAAYAVNSAGTVVFRNRMPAGIGSVTAADDGIVLVGTPGNLSIMLREGSPWPGAGATGEIVDRTNTTANVYPTNALRLNEAGQVLRVSG